MKANLFVTALIVLIGATANAKNPDSSRVAVISQKNADTFKVIYEGEKPGDVRMTILNENKEIVFAETTKNVNGFMRNVNFAGMNPGVYTFEITDGNGKQVQKVAYATETFTKSVRVSRTAEEGKYLLAVANNGSQQINVRIFDGADNLVHSQDLTVNGNLKLVYNLKSVAGVPTFEVTDRAGNVRTIKY